VDDLLTALLAQAPAPRDAALLSGFPSVDLFSRYRLPASGGLYFVLERETILYIGKTVSFRQRWQGHHRLSDVAQHERARIHYLSTDHKVTAWALTILELWCIARFKPRYNNARVVNVWRERFVKLFLHTRRVEALNRELLAKVAQTTAQAAD
jgi:excinuclease UvrABC nuclease subunit